MYGPNILGSVGLVNVERYMRLLSFLAVMWRSPLLSPTNHIHRIGRPLPTNTDGEEAGILGETLPMTRTKRLAATSPTEVIPRFRWRQNNALSRRSPTKVRKQT
jgi:hypothetical protein